MPLLRPISCSDRIETSIVQRGMKNPSPWKPLPVREKIGKRRGYSIGEFSNGAPGGTDIPKPYHGLALPHLPETCNRFSRVSGCQPLTLPLRRWRDEQPPPGTSHEVAEARRLARRAVQLGKDDATAPPFTGSD